MVVLVAPVIEEIVFRGVLQGAFIARWGMWVGISDTLFLVTLPLAFATAAVGFLWVEGRRGFEFIGMAIERSVYIFQRKDSLFVVVGAQIEERCFNIDVLAY